MSGLISPAVRAAQKVARLAMESQASAYGAVDAIVFALDSAQLLRSPLDAEVAAVVHRRVDETLAYLASRDTTDWPAEALGLGLDIVAHLDGPGPRSTDDVPARPALAWSAFLTDVEVGALLEELASEFLDYWRGEVAAGPVLLSRVERLLVKHRDGSQAAEHATALPDEVGQLRDRVAELERLNAAAKAERDIETSIWLGERAREYRATGSRQHSLQADAIEEMASRIAKGLVPEGSERP